MPAGFLCNVLAGSRRFAGKETMHRPSAVHLQGAAGTLTLPAACI